MSKRNKQKPALIKIMFLTLITSLTWVGFEVYGILSQKPKLATPDEKTLAPLDPSLNTQVLENLNLRIYLNQQQIEDSLLVAPSEQEPQPTQTPIPVENPDPEEAENNE